VTEVVKAANGDLVSGGKLTLISTALKTALIDGSGTGQVTGPVNIQRYLASAFGYKYFSSPFQDATVGQFATWVNLGAAFPTFYRYDENNTYSGNAMTGWIKYVNSSGVLDPMKGYSANFGSSPAVVTVNLTGTVTNGNQTVNLANHDRTYSQGFNLVGNPYPSPIDWNSPNWVKTNVDNAIYFFDASTPGANAAANDSLQYQGTYSSYVNGVSNNGATNIIAAMQAFFVHVPLAQGTGSLTFTNGTRVTAKTPVFKSAKLTAAPQLRISAGFSGAKADPAVLYFNDLATPGWEGTLDALKMMNTDYRVPNLYFQSPDGKNLSINAIPFPQDSLTRIPLGLRLAQSGTVSIRIENGEQMLAGLHIYLEDKQTGTLVELKQNQPGELMLNAGVYENRFDLLFSYSVLTSVPDTPAEEMFTIIPTGSVWMVNVKLAAGQRGTLQLINMPGQVLVRREVMGSESVQLDYPGSSGVYVITLFSGKDIFSKKLIIRK
jgi:hypothetical protein